MRLLGLSLGATALLSLACNVGGALPPGGGLGVTPGGSQDIGYARTIIEEGGIPDRASFTAEGLFSEHDLPFENAPACAELLCPHAAVAAVDPVDGSGRGALVQIGFLTNIGADFERSPLDLAIAVDISGSMAEGEKMTSTRTALQKLVGQLDEGDRLAIIAFDDVAELRMESAAIDDAGRARALAVIEALAPDGSTNIEAGMLLAYQQVAPRAAEEGVEHRVMLFTDAMPNVGATSPESFVGMARINGEAGIGLSAFGVGIDFGAQLADEISKTRGGNFFYLKDEAAIATVFDDDFDLIVTPLAYDLDATLTSPDGVTLRRSYGAPTDAQSEEVAFAVRTLFLSRKGGGMGVVLDVPALEAGVELGAFHLAYSLEDGTRVEQDVDVEWSGGRPFAGVDGEADDLGVLKMSALVDEFLALEGAATFCEDGETNALARIEAARARLDALATQLDDAPLAAEAVLLAKLADNVTGGTANCRASQ